MDRRTAITVFSALEEARYEYTPPEGETSEHPHLNVRLDAMTTRDDEREYRLFVRIDDGSPKGASEDMLRFICEQAKEHGLDVTIENGGVELTG